MRYQDFQKEIEEEVRKSLGCQCEVSVKKVRKNNGVYLDCLVVHLPEQGLAPSFHLDECFESFLSGRPIRRIAEEISDCCRHSDRLITEDFEYLHDFGRIRKHLSARLVNREKNTDILDDVPHLDVLNLSIIFYCLLDSTADSEGGFLVNNSLKDAWGVSGREICSAAFENMALWNPAQIKSIGEVMSDVFGEREEEAAAPEEEIDLYVLSNRRKMYGAVWITEPDIQKRIADMFRGDYYVLPSSVHECLVLPVRSVPDEGALLAMVTDINKTQVEEEEFLADAVYRYDSEHSRLLLAAAG